MCSDNFPCGKIIFPCPYFGQKMLEIAYSLLDCLVILMSCPLYSIIYNYKSVNVMRFNFLISNKKTPSRVLILIKQVRNLALGNNAQKNYNFINDLT